MRQLLLVLLLILPACAQDLRTVTEPVIPPACTSLTAHLAEVDESRLDTARIQKALDSCAAGRAVVLQADGEKRVFLSGPLHLRRGVTLLIEAGVTLYASRNPRDYDRRPGSCGIVDQSGRGCYALINGDGADGAAVMGDGVIEGRGGAKLIGKDVSWWDLAEKARAGGNQNCPRLVVINRSDNFTLYRITLRNSPNFHVTYSNGNGFTAWGVKIWSPQRGARNTDGIDPGNSSNVTITRCFIHTGDDNVAIKAGAGRPTTNITVSHNHFYAGHGMSIGSNTDGGARAIRVTDLSIDGADNGLRIKSNSSRGGLVEDVVYEDVCIRNTKNPILMDSHYSFRGPAEDKLPHYTGIVLRNVRVMDGGKITLDGYDAKRRLGMTFDNVVLDSPAAIKLIAVHGDFALGPGPVNFQISGEDVTVTGKPGDGAPNVCQGKFVEFPGK